MGEKTRRTPTQVMSRIMGVGLLITLGLVAVVVTNRARHRALEKTGKVDQSLRLEIDAPPTDADAGQAQARDSEPSPAV